MEFPDLAESNAQGALFSTWNVLSEPGNVLSNYLESWKMDPRVPTETWGA